MKSGINTISNEDPYDHLNNAKSEIDLSGSLKPNENNENQLLFNDDNFSLIQNNESISPDEVNKIELSFSNCNNDDKKMDTFKKDNILRDATVEFVMNINVDKDKNITKERNEFTAFTNKNEEPYGPQILAEGNNKISNGCNCTCNLF